MDFFRDLTIDSNGSRKHGGFDPYKGLFVISSEDALESVYNVTCGNVFYRQLSEPFTYNFNINSLLGNIVLSYEVISGEVSIQVVYNETTTTETELTGTGDISIARNDPSDSTAVVTITPVDEAVVKIVHTCPVGTALRMAEIVLCDEYDLEKTMVNRIQWGTSSPYSRNIFFDEVEEFIETTGVEGVGKYPSNGSTVKLTAFKGILNTGSFNNLNSMKYLVSDAGYGVDDIEHILADATDIPVSQTMISSDSYEYNGSFVFTRPTTDHLLYLIWDYRNPEIIDSYGSTNESGSI